MRVWALASCGGLLALTACSADQTRSPQVDSTPSPADDAAQIKEQAKPVFALPRRVSRPEVRFSRLRTPTALTTRGPSLVPRGEGASLSVEALRARVQQIRAQRARSIPLTVASFAHQPTPRTVAATPTPGETATSPTSSATDTDSTAAPTIPGRALLATAQQVVSPLLTPPRPSPTTAVQPSEILATGTRSAQGREAIAGPESSPNTDLEPTGNTPLTRNLSIRPRHQGYSLRLGAAPTLTPRVSQLVGQQPSSGPAETTPRVARVHQTSRPVATSGSRDGAVVLPSSPAAAETAEVNGGHPPTTSAPPAITSEVLPAVEVAPIPETPQASRSNAHGSESNARLTVSSPTPAITPTTVPAAPRFSNGASPLVTGQAASSEATPRPVPSVSQATPPTPGSAPGSRNTVSPAESQPLHSSAPGTPSVQVRPSLSGSPTTGVTPPASEARGTTPIPLTAPSDVSSQPATLPQGGNLSAPNGPKQCQPLMTAKGQVGTSLDLLNTPTETEPSGQGESSVHAEALHGASATEDSASGEPANAASVNAASVNGHPGWSGVCPK